MDTIKEAILILAKTNPELAVELTEVTSSRGMRPAKQAAGNMQEVLKLLSGRNYDDAVGAVGAVLYALADVMEELGHKDIAKKIERSAP